MLYQATGEARYLESAETLAATARTHHRDAANGSYFLAADDTTDLVVRTKVVFDNATPSGNGVMGEVLGRLWLLTGKTQYRDDAEALIAALTPEDPRGLLNQPSLASAVDLLESGLQIVVVGSGEAANGLMRAATRVAPPLSVLSAVGNSDLFSESHPVSGKGLVDGKPAAYVCRGPVCGLPATEPEALERAIKAPGAVA